MSESIAQEMRTDPDDPLDTNPSTIEALADAIIRYHHWKRNLERAREERKPARLEKRQETTA